MGVQSSSLPDARLRLSIDITENTKFMEYVHSGVEWFEQDGMYRDGFR